LAENEGILQSRGAAIMTVKWGVGQMGIFKVGFCKVESRTNGYLTGCHALISGFPL